MSLTTEGLERPRLPEIKADYDARFTEALGPVNTAPDAVMGQIIAIFSAAVDDINELMQGVYDSMYPSTAEGTSLDGSVQYVGLTRLPATPTTAVAMCYGSESTLLPAGVIARADGNVQYVTTADHVISRANCGDAEIQVTTVTNSVAYQVIANGFTYTYNSDASATAEEIAAGLSALIAADFVSSATGDKFTIRNAEDQEFPLTVDSKLSITKLGSPVAFTCRENGANALPVGALNKIDSGIVGWDSVYNFTAGAIGRATETDEELRERQGTSASAVGSATARAIRARLLAEVPSVTYVRVYENRTSVIDADNLPPHSIEVVVVGGANQAVADKLFEVKGGGIETYGNTALTVMDENGDSQPCEFSRPVPQYAWARVTVDSYNPEELTTEQLEQAIKDAVVAYGATLEIGANYIPQRLYGPIYNNTSGLDEITIEIAVTATEGGPPTYVTTPVDIGRTEQAVFAASRVTVLGL